MQADKIPDEIMREADWIADGHHARRTIEHAKLSDVIARALMARDKRAAEIAREWRDSFAKTVPGASIFGDLIAKSILTYGGRDEQR